MLTAAREYHSAQQHLTALAVRQLRRKSSLPETLRLLAVYQATAATLAAEYGTTALREQRVPTEGAAVNPAAFTTTQDPSSSVLLDVETDRQFNLIVSSLVADAGRSAMGAWIASRRTETGYIRTLTPPSCSRCAILAGRWYRWSDGFQRHPGCDCEMVPGPRSAAVADPYGAFERGEIGSYRTMPDGTRRFESGLSRAQTKAIEDGADISQVVNASRGMRTVNFGGRRIRVTTEGTTGRALAYSALSTRGTTTTRYVSGVRPVARRVASAPRLTPETIYRIAGDDRNEAIRLLRINGYLL